MNKNYLKAQNIIKKLLEHNFQAYFVGGFVRDRLLGLDINDIDITTNALPSDVQNIFEKTRATGIKYGTITVFQGDQKYELTTYRADIDYMDHRKPERVVFSNDLIEDLKRRDFTINALAMDLDEKIVDMFSGKEDLDKRIIRAIGDPNIRFKEDALRILRAFRFVSKLGFDIESKTYESIKNNIGLLAKISNERILSELKKVFSYPYKEKALKLLFKANICDVFPEFEKGLNLLQKYDEYELNYLEFFALCFYLEEIDIPKLWRFSNKEKTIISKTVELVTVTENDHYNLMIIYRLGKDLPLMANNISVLINPSNNQGDLINEIYNNLPIHKTCDLKFKGQDILELSALNNAEIIGKIIDDITYQVISGQMNNDYQEIRSYVIKILEKKYEEE